MAKLDLKIDFNTLQRESLIDRIESTRIEKQARTGNQLYRRGPVDDICDDSVIPSEIIGKIITDNHDFIYKNFNIKEDKHMNGYARQLACRKVEEKLQKLYDEKGCLTREDVWNAMGVRVVDARNYGKQVVMENSDGKGLSMGVKAAIDEIDDHVYLPYKLPYGLEPLKMWQTDNGYTTVAWTDGTTTSVSTEDDGHATPYGGFCACVVKKLYGSTGQAIKMMEHADKNAKWPAEKKRIEREKLKKIRQANVEMRQEKEKKHREHLIELHMEDIYAKREAERRIAEADEKKVYEP